MGALACLGVGVGEAVITPPLGVELCGYGPYRARRSTGIRDDLRSRAFVFKGNGQRLAVVCNDLIGISREEVAMVRRLVESETGIRAENVMVACTHTHSGPATFFLRGWGEVDPGYVALLPRLISGAVATACRGIGDARLGVGKGRLEGVAVNRVEKNGPTDPEVGVVRVENGDGAVRAVLINFSCHAVVTNPSDTMISRDFPGRAVDVVEAVKKGGKAAFLQGACGDINPVNAWSSDIERPGVMLAGEVLKTLEQITPSEETSLAAASRAVDLPLQLPTAEEVKKEAEQYKERVSAIKSDAERREAEARWKRFYADWGGSMLEKLRNPPKSVEVEVQALKIGDMVLVSSPGELFVEFCLDVKAKSPHRNTFVIGYANDWLGYFPDKEDYERGGYAASMVPRMRDLFPFTPDVGSILSEAMLGVLEQLPR